MSGLREILRGFENGNLVRGAAIVGDDGMMIHDALSAETDAEAVAASQQN